MTIHLVAYVDKMSSECDSERDFYIGKNQKQVGNSSTLKKSLKGDIALVTYVKSGIRYIEYYKLGDPIENSDERCNAWKNEGGNLWKYNFNIESSLTDGNVIEISNKVKKIFRDECKKNNKHYQPFNIRYANVNYSCIYETVLEIITSSLTYIKSRAQ
jgi:hypothetical protein